ncbi:type II secretion system protein [Candidatus Deianiraea vastatrix]|uniref:type II secretion system protein n=1 Tax=Candidatus Deianiraea vastatrix TaxID=2163644 RepID=UPI0011BF183E|nr:type II secretion system protein [Candidatus Deianiraea vastatrix]
MKRKKAFTMIELAIVIFISGMLMAGLMSILNSVSAITKARANKDKVAIIENAIATFFRKYDRLPCPADPTLGYTDAKYGVEQLNSDGICDYTLNYNGTQVDSGFKNHLVVSVRNKTSVTHGSNKIVFGTIPFKTLEIGENNMFDDYNNKFTYVVPQGYATNRKITTNVIYKAISGWTRVAMPARMHRADSTINCAADINLTTSGVSTNDNLCLERVASQCTSGTNANPLITTALVGSGFYKDTDGNILSGDAIFTSCKVFVNDYLGNALNKENIGYILITHGQNGFGAWNKGGTLNQYPTSVKEQYNTFQYYHGRWPSHNMLGSSAVMQFVSDNLKPDFDDGVYFYTMDSILSSVARGDKIFCHQSTVTVDIPSGAPTDVNGFMWQTTMNQTNAPSIYKISNPKNPVSISTATSATLTCAQGGIWMNPVTQ